MASAASKIGDRNTLLSLLMLVIGNLVGTGVNMFLARQADGSEAFGEYAFIIQVALFLGVLAALGVPSAALRFMSEQLARRDLGATGRILRSSHLLLLLGCLVTFLLTALVLAIRQQFAAPYSLILPLIPVLVIPWMLETRAKVQHRVVLAVGPRLVLLPIFQAAIAGLTYWWSGAALSPTDLLLSYLGAGALSSFLMWLRLNYTAVRFPPERSEAQVSPPAASPRSLLEVGLPILMVTSLAVIMSQVDIFMLRSILGARETGIYFAAVRLAALLPLPLVAVNVLAGARYSALWNSGQRIAFQALARRYSQFIMMGVLPLLLFMMLAGDWLLGLHGTEYLDGGWALRIRLLGQVVNTFVGSTALILNMTGHQSTVAWIFGVCCLLNIVGNALLIPLLGIEGAAITSAVSLSIWNVWLWVLIRRRLGADTSWLSSLRRPAAEPTAP